MNRLRKMVKVLRKSFSSNKLLKCVLLNTAVELFGCFNAPSFYDTPNQSYYWDMENFNHFCATPGAESPCPEITDPSLLTEGITEQVDVPILQTTEQNELPEPELLQASLDSLQNLDFDVSSWLEHTAENEPKSNHELQSIQQKFYFLIPADLITQLLIQDHCGTQTSSYDMQSCIDGTDPTPSIFWDSYDLHESGTETSCKQKTKTRKTLDRYDTEMSLNDLLNFVDEMDVTPSIVWDSYDLHETSCVLDSWFTSNEDFCSYEDLMLMDLPKPSEGNVGKPVSSTPWFNRKNSRL